MMMKYPKCGNDIFITSIYGRAIIDSDLYIIETDDIIIDSDTEILCKNCEHIIKLNDE